MEIKSYSREIIYGSYTVDKEFNIISIDNKFESITGYSQKDVIEKKLNHLDLIPLNDRSEYLNLVNTILQKSEEAFIEHRIQRKDGVIIYVFCLGASNYDKNGDYLGIKIRITRIDRSISYIEQRKEYRESLKDVKEKAESDDLTRLYRRSAYINKIKLALMKDYIVGLFLIDVDNFKTINDTFGHTKGDEILIQVSEVFKRIVRIDDMICRLGGDEFSIAFLNRTNKELIEIAKRLLNEVSKIKIEEDPSYRVGISIGIANYFDKASSFEEMYGTADIALYESKEKGKNTYTLSLRRKDKDYE